MNHKLINADCLTYLGPFPTRKWTTIFADPPDNVGTKYNQYKDKIANTAYAMDLMYWLYAFIGSAKTVWFSFNAKWMWRIGEIVKDIQEDYLQVEDKLCIQTFTFGQHNQHDLGNNFRPLLRLRWPDAPLLANEIRVPSWRQKHGDKRADARGRIPGDVFDFPRVTGNSRQRRPWHPTQLNEGLVERCIKLTTPPGEPVLDPFAGTGTTLRVCKRTGNPCTLIEWDESYCSRIAEEHSLIPLQPNTSGFSTWSFG